MPLLDLNYLFNYHPAGIGLPIRPFRGLPYQNPGYPTKAEKSLEASRGRSNQEGAKRSAAAAAVPRRGTAKDPEGTTKGIL